MCGIPDGHLPNIRSEVLLVVLTLVIILIEKYLILSIPIKVIL